MPGAYGYKWNHITSVWELDPAVVSTIRLVAVGQVAAGAHKLFWVSMNPSGPDAEIALTDNLTGAGVPVFDMFHATRDHMHMVLSPPMNFTTGIYLSALNRMTSVIFGYI